GRCYWESERKIWVAGAKRSVPRLRWPGDPGHAALRPGHPEANDGHCVVKPGIIGACYGSCGSIVVIMPPNQRKRVASNLAGHAHELTFSCYQGFEFLKAERTCDWLAKSIGEVRTRCDIALWSYVFMPNHVHLIVFPRQQVYGISQILRA